MRGRELGLILAARSRAGDGKESAWFYSRTDREMVIADLVSRRRPGVRPARSPRGGWSRRRCRQPWAAERGAGLFAKAVGRPPFNTHAAGARSPSEQTKTMQTGDGKTRRSVFMS